MVTGPLKGQVDRVWDAFWSGGIANPVEVIEQIGSLGLHRASVGVMITTSTFPRTSHEEVARTHSTNVRLIEGRELAKLMVKHGVGVTVERQIPIRRIDTDVFLGDTLIP